MLWVDYWSHVGDLNNSNKNHNFYMIFFKSYQKFMFIFCILEISFTHNFCLGSFLSHLQMNSKVITILCKMSQDFNL